VWDRLGLHPRKWKDLELRGVSLCSNHHALVESIMQGFLLDVCGQVIVYTFQGSTKRPSCELKCSARKLLCIFLSATSQSSLSRDVHLVAAVVADD